MSEPTLHQRLIEARTLLRDRCAALGLPTLQVDAAGKIAEDQGPEQARFGVEVASWLRSGTFAKRLAELARAWAEEEPPAPRELFRGMWAIPLVETHRRKRSGYVIAFALEPGGLESGEFERRCPAASREQVRRLLLPAARFSRESVLDHAHLLRWTHEDRIEMAAGQEALDGFSSQLSEAYEELTLLYKLGRSMNELIHPSKFVRLLCDELHATLSYRWVAARFVPDPQTVRHLAGRCIVSGDPPREGAAFSAVLDRVIAASPDLAPKAMTLAEEDRGDQDASPAMIVHPLVRDDHFLGSLVVGEKVGGDPNVSSVDMKLLEGAAQHLTILMENSALYDDQQSMFVGTLEALTAAIDAKDPYTCGHSDRVARLAMQLAMASGVDAESAERVRVSGLLHDVGKIGVPERVLCKPGRLTDDEFDLIKQHPEIGFRILRDIPQLADVLPGVLHHHERWDGRGYPHGLSGDEIPLQARILALADSFDAMSSTRTYRSALTRERVLEEIAECAGKQFDPELAPIFCALDFHEYDGLITRRLERESPARSGRAA